SRELALLRASLDHSNICDRSVQIFYRPGDLSRIWVRDPHTLRFHEVLAIHQDYTYGFSHWKHQIIKRYVQEELHRDVDEQSLMLAKIQIQANVQREFHLCQKSRPCTDPTHWLDQQILQWMRNRATGSFDEER